MHFPSRFTLFAITAVSIYFLSFSWSGLEAGFSFDDLMNIYRAERLGWGGHLFDLLAFFQFSSVYRPAGSLFYRVLFEGFGFHALPYRIAIHLLMTANLVLAYLLAHRLSGSRTVAAVCIALFAFHGRYEMFFVNTGYVYDLLCFTFCALAFLYYLHAPKPNVLVWRALYVLALNSKEMAVSLPVLIGIWELLQTDRRAGWWRIPAAGAAINVAFILGRLNDPGEGLLTIPTYRPVISLASYLAHAQAHLADVAYGSPWLTGGKMAVLFVAAMALALLSRNAVLRLSLAWMTIGLLPIAFILQRPLAAAYLPMFGLTLFLAQLIGMAWTERRSSVVLFVSVLLLMTLVHRNNGRKWQGFSYEHARVEELARELRQWQPELASGTRTLMIENPFPGMAWNSTFLAGILARDPAIPKRLEVDALPFVQQENLLKRFRPDERLNFELVLSLENGHLTECEEHGLENLSAAELAQARCLPVERSALLRE